MNTLTGAWTQFNGWNANCFEIYNNVLYFGGNLGDVEQCFAGATDFTSPVNADMQCAYNYFDAPGRVKRMTMVQPFLTAGQTISPQISVDADFTIQTQTAPVQIVSGGSYWDTATWDNGIWFGSVIQTTSWLSTEALGHALAVHLTVNIDTDNGIGVPSLFDFALFDEANFDTNVNSQPVILQVNAFNALLEMGGFV